MSTEIIKQRHAAYQTPEHVTAEIIAQATRHTQTQREKIVHGYDNEVYVVKTHAGGDFIVRINHHDGATFAEEAWAIEQCRQVGVPAPEVLFVGTLALGDLPREVMVQRRMPGRALDVLYPTLTPAELAKIWQQAGAALGAIHSIAVGGFYQLHAGGRWDFPDWASIVQSAAKDRASERPLLIRAGFTAQEVDHMLSILASQPQPSFVQPVLCHGDFLPKHLFINDQLNLSGVIDFGNFQGGTPMVDFANLSMSCPDVDLAWLQRGYANDNFFDGTFPQRLLHAKIGMQIGYLAHYTRQGNPEEAAPIAAGLRSGLHEWEVRDTLTGDDR